MKIKHIFKILIASLIIALSMFFSSCDIMKKSQKSKTDTSIKAEEEIKTFRAGDSVGYRPKLRPRYKDTTIYVVNRQGTTLQTIYDKQGNITDVNCFASRIEELTKRNYQLEQENKEKQSEKTENFDSSFILYIVIGFVILGIVAIIMMFIFINKNTKAVTAVLNNLQK
jgi:flagellar basal body-associated protein FliL